MGIYDESPFTKRRIIIALLVVFLLAEVYLLLPSPTGVHLKLDKSVYARGEKGVLWVEVYNSSTSPISGISLTLDAPDREINLHRPFFILTLPPKGNQVVKVTFVVDENSTYGDHLLRVFVSFPGETIVAYKKVRVG